MSHGDYLTPSVHRVENGVPDALGFGVPMRRAISVALEQGRYGNQEAGGVESALSELKRKAGAP